MVLFCEDYVFMNFSLNLCLTGLFLDCFKVCMNVKEGIFDRVSVSNIEMFFWFASVCLHKKGNVLAKQLLQTPL